MAAIKLLTDEYDRNIVYRQELKSNFFGIEVSEELNFLMTVAFPCAGGKPLFMCSNLAILPKGEDLVVCSRLEREPGHGNTQPSLDLLAEYCTLPITADDSAVPHYSALRKLFAKSSY